MRPPVLDVCCGPRSMWTDPANPAALFGDRRRERRTVTDRSHGKQDGQRVLMIEPDVQFDFRALPFADGSFRLVAFDPPHLVRGGERGWMVAKYGKLSRNWREDIRAGFSECWRVLEGGGVLVFKWNETQVSVSEVMPLTPAQPLFGHRSGHKRLTHWMVFIKPAADHKRGLSSIMKPENKSAYEVADRAWQPVVGCDPNMPCAKRCWARAAVARIVKCQEPVSPERAEFFQIALTPDGKQWSGKTFLDDAHLRDPLKWRKPALVATGFHGDWGRLSEEDRMEMILVMEKCPQHVFMPLTKCPDVLADHFSCPREYGDPWPTKNVTIGCSVMYQSEADKMREPMAALAALGWHTHVWYEPAIGPVDWSGWEFIEQLIIGGESGSGARPFDLQWPRTSIAWCRRNGIAPFVKQLGARAFSGHSLHKQIHHRSTDGNLYLKLRDRKGGDPSEWPADLRVREYPSWMGRSAA